MPGIDEDISVIEDVRFADSGRGFEGDCAGDVVPCLGEEAPDEACEPPPPREINTGSTNTGLISSKVY